MSEDNMQALTVKAPSHAAHDGGSNSFSGKCINNGMEILSTTAVHCPESPFQIDRSTTERDLSQS